ALDLPAVREMPGDVGFGGIERLVLYQFRQACTRFPPQAGFFLPGLLGGDAFVLLALGADRVGLGKVDLLARAGRTGATTLVSSRSLAGACARRIGALGRRARLAAVPAFVRLAAAPVRIVLAGLGRGLEAQSEQLVA